MVGSEVAADGVTRAAKLPVKSTDAAKAFACLLDISIIDCSQDWTWRQGNGANRREHDEILSSASQRAFITLKPSSRS